MQVFVSGRRRPGGGDQLERVGSTDGAAAYSPAAAPPPSDPNGTGGAPNAARPPKALLLDAGGGQQPQPRTGTFSSRDLRLDFFRGLALIFIFIDHIPENILSFFTVQSAQFFDAAEVFIFISGYTAAMVYGRTLEAHGALYAGAQILRRAWQLYVAHIFLFVIFIAEVSYTVTTFNNPMYNDEMQVGEFLTEPHIAIVKALLLQFQPTFLDILPLYIVLLVAFPLVLIGLRLSPLPVVAASLGMYMLVQVDAISVPAYPSGREWYFNPLAWQFLFIAGAALGLEKGWGARIGRRKRPLLTVAAAVVGLAFVVRLSWTIHSIWDFFLVCSWQFCGRSIKPIYRRSVSYHSSALPQSWPPWSRRGCRF